MLQYQRLITNHYQSWQSLCTAFKWLPHGPCSPGFGWQITRNFEAKKETDQSLLIRSPGPHLPGKSSHNSPPTNPTDQWHNHCPDFQPLLLWELVEHQPWYQQRTIFDHYEFGLCQFPTTSWFNHDISQVQPWYPTCSTTLNHGETMVKPWRNSKKNIPTLRASGLYRWHLLAASCEAPGWPETWIYHLSPSGGAQPRDRPVEPSSIICK